MRPPHRAELPLWLALLLKKQRRASILAPPWLHPASLQDILHRETTVDPAAFSAPPPPPRRPDGCGGVLPYSSTGRGGTGTTAERQTAVELSPPFLPSNTQSAPSAHLPYHWQEVGELLLAHAADDVPSAPEVRALLRDLQEVRAAKLRASASGAEDGSGGGLGAAGDGVVGLRGVGALELAANRALVASVVDAVRALGASAEAARRDEEAEDEEAAGGRGVGDSDDEMEF